VTSGEASPTRGSPQRRNINIHPFVCPAKGVKNSEAPHINKDSSPKSVLMLFFTQNFQLLVEQTNLYYQQHLDRQSGPSRRLPDMVTFIALALQMGHDLKDALRDYWTRLETATHSILWQDHDMRQIFTHIAFCAFCRQFRLIQSGWRT
jgi:hypothetical protein